MRKRRHGIGVGATVAAVIAASLATGCLIRLSLGAEYYEDDLGDYIVNLVAGVSTAYCRVAEPSTGIECMYGLEAAGGGVSITSTAELISELGLVGVIIDPLILELPASVRNIRGTYTDGGANSGELLVYPNLRTIPADDGRNFVASAGHQLVIVDLPSGVPIQGIDYDLALAFERPAPPGSPPTEIKAVLTGKIDVGGKTYYPPFLPCTTDLSTVESFTLPQTTSGADPLQPIAFPENPRFCSGENYFYFAAESTNVPCDLDNDTDVDFFDLFEVMRARNVDASPGDPRDINDDGRIDVNDARLCVPTCSRTRCAS